MRTKSIFDRGKISAEQAFEVGIRNVSRRDQKQTRLPREDERLHEVAVFGDDDPVLARGRRDQLVVSRSVCGWQVDRMKRVVAGLIQPTREA